MEVGTGMNMVENNATEDETPEPHGAKKKLISLGAVTAIWLTSAFFLGWFAHPPETCAEGTYRCLSANEWGDFLAGVFAPIAFLWLVGTVMIQSDELREQREELKITREVMKKQTGEAEKQAAFIGLQTAIFQQEKRDEQLRMKLMHFRHFIMLNFSSTTITKINYQDQTIDVGYLTKDTPENTEMFFLSVTQRIRIALDAAVRDGSDVREIIRCKDDVAAMSMLLVLRDITGDYWTVGDAMKTLLQTSGALSLVDELPAALRVPDLSSLLAQTESE